MSAKINYENTTPLSWSDEDIALYVEHSDLFGDAEASPGYAEKLLDAISNELALVERRSYGFAIIHLIFKSVPGTRPKIKSLKYFHIEAIAVFKERAAAGDSKRFFDELIEKFGSIADIRGECFDLSRARLFRRYGCVVIERHTGSNVYDVTFTKKALY